MHSWVSTTISFLNVWGNQDKSFAYSSQCSKQRGSSWSPRAIRITFRASSTSPPALFTCSIGSAITFISSAKPWTSPPFTLSSQCSNSEEWRGFSGYVGLACSWLTAAKPLERHIQMSQISKLRRWTRWRWDRWRKTSRLYASWGMTTGSTSSEPCSTLWSASTRTTYHSWSWGNVSTPELKESSACRQLWFTWSLSRESWRTDEI